MADAKDGSAPKKLGQFSGWEAFQTSQNNNPVCYMILRPAKMDYALPKTGKPKNPKAKKQEKISTQPAKRSSDIFLMITFRPEESMKPVLSYRVGYGYKQGSEAVLHIDAKTYTLFTNNDQAWARNTAGDVEITNAIRAAKRIAVEGTSSISGKSMDILNPAGADKAFKTIAKACGIG